MAPIPGLSNLREMPRLGKIRLGEKVEVVGKKPHPRATEYFVVPDEIKSYVGDKPTALDIMFPSEDPEKFAQQWLRCYSATQGLVCKGDGVVAVRKVDKATGDIAGHTTTEWVKHEGWGCDPNECREYLDKRCRRVMNLLFLLPDVPGIGCWQLDTSSFHSIVNVNSQVALPDRCGKGAGLLRLTCGRVSFLPLVLALKPRGVSPSGGTTKVVHVLTIQSKLTLGEIQLMGKDAPPLITMPTIHEDEAPEDIEATPDPVEVEPAPAEVVKGERTPADITEADVPDWTSVAKLVNHFWKKVQPADLARVMGYSSTRDAAAASDPWSVWLTAKAEFCQRQEP